MGYKKFIGFTKMLNFMADGDYKNASLQILHSEWADEVKGRATQDADIMLNGVL